MNSRRLSAAPAENNNYPRHNEFQEKIAQFSLAELAEALKRLILANQTKTYLSWQK
jgi:hypothetical protein